MSYRLLSASADCSCVRGQRQPTHNLQPKRKACSCDISACWIWPKLRAPFVASALLDKRYCRENYLQVSLQTLRKCEAVEFACPADVPCLPFACLKATTVALLQNAGAIAKMQALHCYVDMTPGEVKGGALGMKLDENLLVLGDL
jgi:hypothetical protein